MGTKKRPEGTVPWMPGFRYGALLLGTIAIAVLFVAASTNVAQAQTSGPSPAPTVMPTQPPLPGAPTPPTPPVVPTMQPGDILWMFAQEPPLFDGRVAQAIAMLMTDRMPASTLPAAHVILVAAVPPTLRPVPGQGPDYVPGVISRLDQVPLLLRAAGFGQTPPFIQVGQCMVWAGPAQAGVDPKAVAAALGTALQQALASLGVQPAAPTKVDAQCGVAANASAAHLLVWVNGDPRPPVVPRRDVPTFLSWQGFVRPASTGNAGLGAAGTATGAPFEASAAIALILACALVAGGRLSTARRERPRA